MSPPSRKFLLALLFSAVSHAVAITLVDPGATPAPVVAPLRVVLSPVPALAAPPPIVSPEKLSRTPDQAPEPGLKPEPTPKPVVKPEAIPEPAPKPVLKKVSRPQKPRPRPAAHLPAAKPNPPPAAQEQITVATAARTTTIPAAPDTAAVTAESRKVEYLYNPPPDYPQRARRLGLEGEVLIRTRVLTNGESDQLVLERSSGHELLDQAALEAVRKWRFLPARRGDEQIVSWVEIPVRFRLER